MAKRSKVSGVAGESVVEVALPSVSSMPSVGELVAADAAEQARGSQASDLVGLAAREAAPGVAVEGRVQLERRARALAAVGELERVVAHHGDARVGGAIVRALRAVVAAL
jgi:hypothetical protein